MNRSVLFAMMAVAGWVLAGGSTGWGAPHHATHPVAKKPAPHPAKPAAPPKHGGGKPAHNPGHNKENGHKKEKGTAEEAHKNGAAKPGEHKHEPGKETRHEVHKPDAAALKEHERVHEHHEDHLHHRHGVNGVVDGVEVVPGVAPAVVGGAVVGGGGVAVPAGPADVAPSGGSLSGGRPQIHFSVDVSERDAYDGAARAAGLSRSEWIRTRLNAAASRERR
jgi:hypothetical protein